MYLKVNQCRNLGGLVCPPSSKSQSIRGMLLALLAEGKSTLSNVLDSADTQIAMQVCRALGARVNLTQHTLTVDSDGVPFTSRAAEINTGNSGVTTRFILPLLGLREDYNIPIFLSCGEQMQRRPIKSLVDALCNLGMQIRHVEQAGRLPLLVSGQLKGGTAEVDGITSQYLSALLIGLPCADNDSVITVRNLHERPYVNMTLNWLKQQEIVYTHQAVGNVDTFLIPGNQRYTPICTTIEGDFSSASYLIAAAVLLPGEVELLGLDIEASQGDKQLISILQKMGAEIAVRQDKIVIDGDGPLTGARIDANDIPDLVPVLAVIATRAKGKTEIYNVQQARLKETDRIHSMTEGLRLMGARVEEHQDGMTVYQSRLAGAMVKGYEDHRTVMALTVAGMIASGTTSITDAESIGKTYPQFVEHMQSIGAHITVHETMLEKHIILIGFKHVGKTLLGQQLAKRINKHWIDLDKEVEKSYEHHYHKSYTCRQIMQAHGESHYREIESVVLQEILKLPSCVISLGGGTPLSKANQELLKSHRLIHVVAPDNLVFARLMAEGRPAFFDPNKDPYESFTHLWSERNKIYRKLTPYTVNNNATIEHAVNEAMAYLYDKENVLI